MNCTSAEHLLEELSTRSEHFAESPYRDWIFRGHASSEWDLTPSAFRSPEGLNEFIFSRRPWPEWDNRDQIQVEAATLGNFVEAADSAGLSLPGDLPALLLEFDKPFQESWYIKDIEAGEVEWPPQITWATVALAQHYGLATRFLDWTRSALVAAYFAATESFSQPKDVTAFAIWAFSTSSDAARRGLTFRHGEPTRLVAVVTPPYSSNANLFAQSGVHVARSATRIRWSDAAERYDLALHLEKVGAFGRQLGRTSLLRFVLKRSEAPAVLWYLAKDGVTAARLFPGYSGAVRSVLEEKLRTKPQRS